MLIGNITRDPEIKFTPKGTAIASFGLAVNESWKNEAGQKQEKTTFIDCEAYGKVAEIIGEYCKKGRPLFVEGKLRLATWEDKKTNEKRSKINVVVENIQLLGSREGGNDNQPSQKRPQSAPVARKQDDPDLDVAPDGDIPF